MALHDLCKKSIRDYADSHPDEMKKALPKMVKLSSKFLTESSVPAEVMALRKMKCVQDAQFLE